MNSDPENEQPNNQKIDLEHNTDTELSGKELSQAQDTPSYKLFSRGSIYGGSLFGGPPAFIYFLYRNNKSLGQKRKAWLIVLYGIIGVAGISALLVVVESHFRIILPHYAIASGYYGLAAGIYQSTQQQLVTRHKELGGAFYSGWRALIISLLSLALVVSLVFAAILYDAKANRISVEQQIAINYGSYDQASYFRLSDQITQNDKDALTVNDKIETASSVDYVAALDSGIAKYKQNLNIAEQIKAIDKLPQAALERNEKTIEYTNLRIQEFTLRKKEEIAQTDIYKSELEAITQQINELLAQIGA